MHRLTNLLLVLPLAAADLDLPRVDLIYQPGGTVFDRNCAELTKSPADLDLINETARRTAEFQRRWNSEGPPYLKAALAEVGAPFPYSQMQATLTVCAPTSMSSPLLINVSGHLSKTMRPLPDWYFAFVVFHELMHHYTRVVYEDSTLRKKYAIEKPVTLNHMHVMALEKFVLKKLSKIEELKELDERYRQARMPATYRRAWEIVGIEGENAFIQELKGKAVTDSRR